MDNEHIEERLQQIESRLDRIEKGLSSSAHQTPAAETKIKFNLPKSEPFKTPGFLTKPGNWLGFVAVLCFVVAAGFIIKLSIDSGWLTPIRQIGLAYVLGAALIIAGFILHNYDKEYASFLPGAGIVIFYLTTFAGNQYYSIFSFELGIAITSLVSIFCIYIYLKIRHDIYFILAVLGAYLSPLIIGYHAAPVFALYYYLLCSFAFAVISIWLQSRLLILIAAYLAIFSNCLIGFDLYQDQLIASVLPVHFIIFAIGNYIYSLNHKSPLTSHESWAFFPVLVTFYGVEYYFVERVYPGMAPWLSLLFAVVIVGLYLVALDRFKQSALNSQSMIVAFVTLVIFHSVYLELLPADFKPWLIAIFLIAASLVPVRWSNKNTMSAFIVPLIAIATIIALEYISLLWDLVHDTINLSASLAALFAFLSLWLVMFRQRVLIFQRDEFGYGMLSAAHLLAITGLYNLTHDISSLLVSASWLLYAICVMGIAYVRKDKIMAKSAIVVLSVAAAKALLFDAASAATIIRILCLLLTGIVLYGAGFLMKKIGGWKLVK